MNLITGSESADRFNIACQLDIHFIDPVKIVVQVVKNGQAKPVNDEKAPTISFQRSDGKKYHLICLCNCANFSVS